MVKVSGSIHHAHESLARDAGQQLVGKQAVSQPVGTTFEESEMGMLSTSVGSATCVQPSIGSRNPADRNAYRTSLRPSSLSEPRHPSLEVVETPSESFLGSNKNLRRGSRVTRAKLRGRLNATQRGMAYTPYITYLSARINWIMLVMILPQVHLRKPCYDFSFL